MLASTTSPDEDLAILVTPPTPAPDQSSFFPSDEKESRRYRASTSVDEESGSYRLTRYHQLQRRALHFFATIVFLLAGTCLVTCMIQVTSAKNGVLTPLEYGESLLWHPHHRAARWDVSDLTSLPPMASTGVNSQAESTSSTTEEDMTPETLNNNRIWGKRNFAESLKQYAHWNHESPGDRRIIPWTSEKDSSTSEQVLMEDAYSDPEEFLSDQLERLEEEEDDEPRFYRRSLPPSPDADRLERRSVKDGLPPVRVVPSVEVQRQLMEESRARLNSIRGKPQY